MTRVLHRLASEKGLAAVELATLAILALLAYSYRLQTVEFHPDETYWIVTSTRLESFLRGDASAASWPEGFGSYEVRPVPSYVVGIAQRLAGISPAALPPESWNWSEDAAANLAGGRMPTQRVLLYSRLPMAILAALGIALTAWLLANSVSRLSGYVFLAIAVTSPYLLLHLRRAMSEACLFFFTMLALGAIYRTTHALRSGRIWKSLAWCGAAGALAGLAGECKLVGLGLAVIGFATVCLVVVRSEPTMGASRLRLLELHALVIGLTTSIVFIGSYPFFYQKTLERLVGTFTARSIVLQAQLETFSSEVIVPDQRGAVLLNAIFGPPFGLPTAPDSLLLPLLTLGLALVGVYHVFKGSLGAGGSTDMSSLWLIASIGLGTPMLFTPLDWDRYYLYPIVFAVVFVSIGVSQACLTALAALLRGAAFRRSRVP